MWWHAAEVHPAHEAVDAEHRVGEGTCAADVIADETQDHGQAQACGAFDTGDGAPNANPYGELVLCLAHYRHKLSHRPAQQAFALSARL